ncbi:carbon storage regulator CsrA [Pseudomonadales bacterium]|jgi:carbon storage regulator|nr:carbon storage regulator CsrA [Pseudomonadales bacterium]
MLILTRRIGEKLLIGDNIEVVVLDVNRNQVKVGIKAPRDMTVLREELYVRDKRAQYIES